MARRADLSRYALESVDRMAAVLAALEEAPDRSLDDVARAAGLNSSTALRYLLSLSKHGLVERNDDTGLFQLGLQLFRLGTLSIGRRNVLSLAEPIMSALQDQFGESVNLAGYQFHRVTLLRVLVRPDSLRKEGKAGDADPWHATSLGKAILAALPAAERAELLSGLVFHRYTPNTRTSAQDLDPDLATVTRQGYSVDDEEVVEGLRCVGVAVRGASGRVQYGLSISGPKSRMTYTRIHEIGAVLIQSSAALSARLGGEIPAGQGEALVPGLVG